MTLKLGDIHIGWISALPIEALLAEIMLDEPIEQIIALPPNDNNIYAYGRIKVAGSNASHTIAIAQLPLSTDGKASAATVANNMRRTFPNLKFGIMVGIAGGVWSPEVDVRLGDIVVGVPDDGGPGVIQYDHGKAVQEREFVVKGTLNKAPDLLRTAAGVLKRKHMRKPGDYVSHLENEEVKQHAPRPKNDNLFSATYVHQGGRGCDHCDKSQIRDRLRRTGLAPRVHYGAIASGDQVVKDAILAEKIQRIHNIMCFEMEAAGLDAFPCIVVRGISDYADTHKNDDWHAYAAGVAAAYAKELLSVVPVTAVAELPSTGNTHWNVPRAPNPLFAGRHDLLNTMKGHLITEQEKKELSVFVLQGIGGAGKSEAAIKFAMDCQDSFWGIFWIDADNRQSIEQGFAEIAKMQVPPLEDTTSRNVIQWLANTKESWLLILDNCDDDKIDFAEYIPSRGGSVIITTRLKECWTHGLWENIDDLGPETAIQLLLKASGLENGDQDELRPIAESVISILGQHALALVHAGAYIKRGHCSLSEYIEYFRDEQDRLMKFMPKQRASRYESVYATFEVSAKALATSDEHDSHLALNLLNILAFLDREAVDEDLFIRAFDESQNLENECGFVWEEVECRGVQQCAVSDTGYETVVKHHDEPKKFDNTRSTPDSVCTWKGEFHYIAGSETRERESMETHSSVQSMTQCPKGTERSTDFVPRKSTFLDVIQDATASDCSDDTAASTPSGFNDSETSSYSTVDDADYESSGIDNFASGENDEAGENRLDHDEDSEIYDLCIWHCDKVRASGLVEYQKSTRLRAACVRLADLSLIKLYNNRISVHPLVHEWAFIRLREVARQDAWEQTLSLLALRSRGEVHWFSLSQKILPHLDVCTSHGRDQRGKSLLSLNVVRSLYALAWHYHFRGQHEKALAIFKSLSRSYRHQPHTWSSRSKALEYAEAMCLQSLGRFEEMQSCVAEIVQSTTRWFASDSLEVHESQALVADVHLAGGRFEDAAKLYESLYERTLRHSMLNDVALKALYGRLSRTHQYLGNNERSTLFLVEELKIAERIYPAYHPDRLHALKKTALLYIHAGAAEKAVTLLEDVVKQELKQKSQDYSWVWIMSTLARAYEELGAHDRAIPIFKEILSHYSNTVEAEDTKHISTMYQLAMAHYKFGEPTEAATLLQEIVDIQESSLPPDNLERLSTMNWLARMYLELGQPSQAIMLLEEVVVLESDYSSNDLRRALSMDALAEAYLMLDNISEAVSLLEEVVEIGRSSLAPNDRERLCPMDRLASTYLKIDEPSQAATLLEEVLRCFPAQDPGRSASLDRLAEAYLRLDRPSQAVRLLEQVVVIDASNLPPDDPGRLISVARLAETYVRLDRFDQAVPLLEEVIALDSNHFAEEDTSRLSSMRRLAQICNKLGTDEKLREAIPLLEHMVDKGRETLHAGHEELVRTRAILTDAQEKLQQTDQQQSVVDSMGNQLIADSSLVHEYIRGFTRRAALMF